MKTKTAYWEVERTTSLKKGIAHGREYKVNGCSPLTYRPQNCTSNLLQSWNAVYVFIFASMVPADVLIITDIFKKKTKIYYLIPNQQGTVSFPAVFQADQERNCPASHPHANSWYDKWEFTKTMNLQCVMKKTEDHQNRSLIDGTLAHNESPTANVLKQWDSDLLDYSVELTKQAQEAKK